MAVGNSKTIQRKSSAKRPIQAKRPAARRVQARPSEFNRILRENLHWLVLGLAAIGCGLLLFYGYQRAVASSFFAVKRVDVAGAINVERGAVEQIVRGNSDKTGVWNADLERSQKEIEAIAWVKTAVVSRVLPDGLRVRIVERTAQAVVKLGSGATVWVDEDARILGEAAGENILPVVLSGWNEDKSPEALKRNQERVKFYLKLIDEWRKTELVSRVSEINLADLQDVGATVRQNDQLIQTQIGSKDFSERLKTILIAVETIAANNNLEMVERVINYDGHPVVSFKNADFNVKTTANKTTTANQPKPSKPIR